MLSPVIVFAANLGATLALTGVSWFVQVVHYPLFARVTEPGWAGYATEQQRRLMLALAGPMLLELVTAGLLIATPPVWLPRGMAVALASLVGVVWLLTFRLEQPLRTRLARRFDGFSHKALVLSHWVRVLAWWTRSSFLLLIASQVLTTAPSTALIGAR